MEVLSSDMTSTLRRMIWARWSLSKTRFSTPAFDHGSSAYKPYASTQTAWVARTTYTHARLHTERVAFST